jgi:cell division protein FtsA
MAYADFIAAIYLGTSRITGIVGRNEGGTLTVIAYETEFSGNCIIRGCLHNLKETGVKIKGLIRRLESKIPGSRIGKVYVGVGGQSVRSVEHRVSLSLETDHIVTDEIVDRLYEECKTYQPGGLEVWEVLPSAYYLDGRAEPEPVGVSCSRIEARYNLIVARPSIRKHIVKCITEFVQIEIAGILVAPLALANMVLSESEKNRGCALIDFGAGVTSLSVYKNGSLLRLCVIPLGGNLITRDIVEFLKVGEPEAEQLKRKYGNAFVIEDDLSTFQIKQEQMDWISVKLADFNKVVENRQREILENVYDKLEHTIDVKTLRAGVIITGKAANMENLTAVIYNRLDIDVRYASAREDLNITTTLQDVHPDGVVLGLLSKGTVNCSVIHTATAPSSSVQPPLPSPPTYAPPVSPAENPETVRKTDSPSVTPTPRTENEKKKKKLTDILSGFAGDLFNET